MSAARDLGAGGKVMRYRVVRVLIQGILLAAFLSLPEDGSATRWAQRAPNVEGAAEGAASELDEAWERAGCTRNPGNPACAIISQAASCADSPNAPACQADRDEDGCLDVAEVRAGLDPYNAADCLGDGQGAPLVNCLFLIGNARCNEPPVAAPADPSIDCPPLHRNPECDGFAPETGR